MLSFLGRVLTLVLVAAALAVTISGLVGAALFVVVLQGFAEELPRLSSAEYRPRQTTRIYDRNGEVLADLHAEVNRAEIVPFTEIPQHTRLAFVAIEDDQFFEHYGVRVDALVRAVIKNAILRRKSQGGSTITMQLVRNRFLDFSKTYTRKLKEIIMSFRLERKYSKDEILGQYLNEVFFGGNIYGISAAARHYFGKPVRDLTLAESAVLAGILPAPNKYNPRAKMANAKLRQQMVLTKMAELGYITPRQADEAYQQRLVMAGEEATVNRAPYFVDHVTRWLIERYGVKRVYGGGLKVRTTLDPEAQAAAEKAFADAEIFQKYPLEQYPDLHGALLVLDPLQGEIRAMIGGRDFEAYKFNRATQARRQPGSSFKFFVYAQALAQGIQPNAIVNDEPVRYLIPNTQEFWEPQNSTGVFHGPVTLAQALEQSYNVVAVKLLERVGVDKTVELAKRLGVKSPLAPDLALALGTSEVTLLEMVSAYGAVANGGVFTAPHAVSRVEDDEGNVLFEARITEREVLDPRVAFQLTTMLRGVVERGTGFRARVPGYQIAGKTGTTQNKADAWFIGYTPDLVVGASVGFDTRRSLGKQQTGGRAAAAIVGAFNQAFLTRAPAREFPRPEGLDEIEVCKGSGFLPLSGCKRRQSLLFVQGRGPASYCHLHQAVEFKAGGARAVKPPPKRPAPPPRSPAVAGIRPPVPAPALPPELDPGEGELPEEPPGRPAAPVPGSGLETELDLSF